MSAFAEYLQTHQIQPFEVSLAAGVRYFVVWHALHDHPISADHADKIRRGVQEKTGRAYEGPLVMIAEQPTEQIQAPSPLAFTSADLCLMEHVLLPYAKGMRENLLPSGKRDAHLEMILGLRQRIGERRRARVSEKPSQFLLSSRELVMLACALATYGESMGRSVPPSLERDTLMRQCATLRERLLKGTSLSHRDRHLLLRGTSITSIKKERDELMQDGETLSIFMRSSATPLLEGNA